MFIFIDELLYIHFLPIFGSYKSKWTPRFGYVIAAASAISWYYNANYSRITVSNDGRGQGAAEDGGGGDGADGGEDGGGQGNTTYVLFRGNSVYLLYCVSHSLIYIYYFLTYLLFWE